MTHRFRISKRSLVWERLIKLLERKQVVRSLAPKGGMANKHLLIRNLQRAQLPGGEPRVKGWRVWLLRGAVSGLVAGTVFLTNGTGAAEPSKADDNQAVNVKGGVTYSVLPFSKASSGEVWTHVFEDPASSASPTVLVLTFGPAAIYRYSGTWSIGSELSHDPALFQLHNSETLYVAYNTKGQVVRIRNGVEEPFTAALNQYHEPSIVMRSEADGRLTHGIKEGLSVKLSGEVFRLDGSTTMTKLADLKCVGVNASIAVLQNGAYGYACYH